MRFLKRITCHFRKLWMRRVQLSFIGMINIMLLVIMIGSLYVFYQPECLAVSVSAQALPLHPFLSVGFTQPDRGSIWTLALVLLLSSAGVALYPFNEK